MALKDVPSTKRLVREGFEEMYKELHDPEKRAEAARLTARTKRIEDKKADTGL